MTKTLIFLLVVCVAVTAGIFLGVRMSDRSPGYIASKMRASFRTIFYKEEKRQYEFRKRRYEDRVQDPGEPQVTISNDPRLLGVEPPDEPIDELIADLGSGSTTERDAIHRLRTLELDGADLGSRYLEGLLLSLEGGMPDAAWALTGHVDDPRARADLIRELSQTTSNEMISNVMIAVSIGPIKGEDIDAILLEKHESLAGNPKTYAQVNFNNEYAGALLDIAKEYLNRHSGSEIAANTLIKLTEHPTKLNRHAAFATISGIITSKNPPKNEIFSSFIEILQTAGASDDAELFFSTLPALLLLGVHPSLLDRAEEHIANGDPHLRERGTYGLTNVPSYYAPHAIKILQRRLRTEESVKVGLQIAQYLAPLIEPPVLQGKIKKALAHESPSIRQDGIMALYLLPATSALEVARPAKQQEPDNNLRDMLSNHIEVLEKQVQKGNDT